MTEPRDDDAFDGIDGPRPLSPEFRERLIASIVASAGPLRGTDAPRPLPAPSRQRLVRALAMTGNRKRDLRPRIAAVAAAFVLLAGVAVAATRDDRRPSPTAAGGTPMERPATTTTTTTTTTAPPAEGLVGALAGSEPVVIKLDFKQSCDELLDYLRTNGAERVTAYGLGGNRGVPVDTVVTTTVPTTGGNAGTPTAMASAAPASTTNNQEKGVDEPDIVQNDGRYIYVLSYGTLKIVDAGSSPPQAVASIDVPPPSRNMFLAGDRLVLLGSSITTTVTTVDVSDPAAPVIADAVELAGYFVSGRLVDGLARVVTSSAPTVPMVYPADESPEAADAALEANRAAVANSTIDQWIGDRPCDSVGLPGEFSGFDLTTVYTINPGALSTSESASVAAGGEMVYASTSSLYVTSMRWDAWQASDGDVAISPDAHTQVHRFDITGTGAPAYIASGQVTGYALSQYSLSEQAGDLRIATTNHPQWRSATGETASAVTVLRLVDGELRQIGNVGGLGPGETIHGVRFVGDLGFVVTFRQTDPLYVVDLRDPTDPQVRGELKVTGFSGYLHPIDPGFLVGVGMAAAENGQVTGGQVSVFDVRNLDDPSLVNRVELPNEYSPAGEDPHAFLYWEPRSLVVLPMYGSTDSNALLLVADGNGVSVVGRVNHPRDDGCQCTYPPERSLVIGDRLYTVSSYAGVQATNLDTLADEGFAAFR